MKNRRVFYATPMPIKYHEQRMRRDCKYLKRAKLVRSLNYFPSTIIMKHDRNKIMFTTGTTVFFFLFYVWPTRMVLLFSIFERDIEIFPRLRSKCY